MYELRALTLAGFLPGLVACADCVKYEGGAFCFDAATGLLFCAECAAKRGLAANLDAAALAAMRHITYSEDEKLFGFSIGPESLARLGSVVEQYVRYCCLLYTSSRWRMRAKKKKCRNWQAGALPLRQKDARCAPKPWGKNSMWKPF